MTAFPTKPLGTSKIVCNDEIVTHHILPIIISKTKWLKSILSTEKTNIVAQKASNRIVQ